MEKPEWVLNDRYNYWYHASKLGNMYSVREYPSGLCVFHNKSNEEWLLPKNWEIV